MTLGELLSHFTDKTIWCDVCTPLYRKSGEIGNIEKELDMNAVVGNWRFTSKTLEIDL